MPGRDLDQGRKIPRALRDPLIAAGLKRAPGELCPKRGNTSLNGAQRLRTITSERWNRMQESPGIGVRRHTKDMLPRT